ncbi:Long-chain-fatty-acid--AMP ligase FadD32 [Actinomadura rubteroloni]|uniref:Long-chain-fatty-acid--AMP ligase FadD32 n=1 Tax=Actinomadura rubteroloni TaxID=1926885 RepID=A0A2P4UBT6_9ACTN|nr:fatty acyl-AMP ligase [Actinomadura rubteroloni]POM22520.1 Long-chain-fatty-acid--AMP ligase FadD32 [Actinomadura rubteroloni]
MTTLKELDRTPLVQRLAKWAQLYPDDRAYTYMDYSEDVDGVAVDMTWGELDQRARALAATLRQVTDPGQRAALLAPQTLDYIIGFLGCMYARVVAVPLFSPDLPGHADRLLAVYSDSEPETVLTITSALPHVEAFFDQNTVPRPKQIITVDTIDTSLTFEDEPISPDDLAYLQYTSGSTRVPAGVMLTHGNLAVNAEQCWGVFDGIPRVSTGVNWLPLFHDMGLVTAVGLPIAYASPAVLMDPVAFIMRPIRWLELLSKQGHAFTCAPNFAYEYLATKVSDEEKAGLDLSGVQVFMNGAETIREESLQRYLDAYSPYGLRPEVQVPAYGLAEATVYVASSSRYELPTVRAFDRDALNAGVLEPCDKDAERASVLVGCGQPYGQLVAIVDADTGERKPDGHIGEIWIHGPNVTAGYWNRPEETARTFGNKLAGERGDLPEGPWLRSGDLGVWYEGELWITGRIKDLVIIDGRNHYPQDLEYTAFHAHEGVRRGYAAAFSVDGEEGEVLIIVAERNRRVPIKRLDPVAVTDAVRAAVQQHHDVRVHELVLIEPGGLVRTSSGKVSHTATRKAYLDGALPVTDLSAEG